MIASPPQLVGTPTVADLFGVGARHLRARVAAGEAQVRAGYLGKISGKHCWNLHELVASTFTGDAALELVVDRLADRTPSDPLDRLLCAAPKCDEVEERLGLCHRHLHRLMKAWRHAGRSSLVTVQLVAMCRWIVERNAHLVLPAGYDPWSTECMTPGCDHETNTGGWHGPLCRDCSAKFWNNVRGRPRPAHWKPAAT